MLVPAIRDRLQLVDPERLRADIQHLAADPLPFRKLNYTIPGHDRCTLYEADDFITGRLVSLGYSLAREGVQVQAFRCDRAKQPKSSWYSAPEPDDPWYTAYNLYAERPGGERAGETLLLCAHKDSQSWYDSPGAYDNAVGTAGLLEIARLLADLAPRRTVRLLWCNEEHAPWTSVTAAERAKERGDRLAAVINIDGIGGRAPELEEAGRRTNATLYTEEPGRRIAELHQAVNETYGIGLEQTVAQRPNPGDDDGSFVRAGFTHAVVNIGSFPYRHRWYHDERDTADAVDVTNVALAVQVVLGALLHLDQEG